MDVLHEDHVCLTLQVTVLKSFVQQNLWTNEREKCEIYAKLKCNFPRAWLL